MSVKMWAPDHPDGCHIGLTNGTTFLVPNDENGIDVPKEFRRAAIARGCISISMEPEEIEPDPFDRVTTIRGAARPAVARTGAPASPTYQAVPPRDAAGDPVPPARPETTGKVTTADHNVGAGLHDRTADAILNRLQQAGDAGLSRSGIRDLFGRNLGADRIGAALELLQRKGKVTCATMSTGSTGGRPPVVWKARRE